MSKYEELDNSLQYIGNEISQLNKDPIVDQMNNNMADCISNVAYQLERIADALEKQNKAG